MQSPLSQPLVHRNRKVYEKFAKQQNSPIEDMLSEQGRDDIKRVEGILIESFRRKYGHFPLWNSMGGSAALQISHTLFCFYEPTVEITAIAQILCNPIVHFLKNNLQFVFVSIPL